MYLLSSAYGERVGLFARSHPPRGEIGRDRNARCKTTGNTHTRTHTYTHVPSSVAFASVNRRLAESASCSDDDDDDEHLPVRVLIKETQRRRPTTTTTTTTTISSDFAPAAASLISFFRRESFPPARVARHASSRNFSRPPGRARRRRSFSHREFADSTDLIARGSSSPKRPYTRRGDSFFHFLAREARPAISGDE